MNEVLQWAAMLGLYVLFGMAWARLLALNSRLDWDTEQLQQGIDTQRGQSRLTGNWWGPDR